MSTPHDNMVGNIFDRAAERGWNDTVALRDGERSWTYGQLGGQVKRVATALRALRVAKGDRVAVYMSDSREAVAAILGAIYGGAIAVPISELGRANDVRDILNDCGAVAAVVDKNLQPTIDEIRGEVDSLREVLVNGGHGPGEREFSSIVHGAAQMAEPVEVDPESTAFILYTAGPSAAPRGGSPRKRRGIPHSHRTPMLGFESFANQFVQMTESDRVFSVVRVSTAYGLGVGVMFPLLAGAEAVLLREQPHSERIFEVVAADQPTILCATPSVYGQLARDAVAGDMDQPLSHLRACISGAEDMPPKVIARVQEVLGANVWVGYGLTEAFQFVICGEADRSRPGACGRPLGGMEIRILRDDGEPVGVDEIGTLQLRGESVADRYWGDEAAVTQDGWFTTRDRFMRDADGNFYHCGRVDHLFKVGGKWVAPGEVEHALLAHEAVWECAVIGADNEDGLIKPLAFVVPNIGHEPNRELEEELREFVKKELAPYMYPRWIEFVDDLPKGPQGKILRYKLRELMKAKTGQRRAETASPS